MRHVNSGFANNVYSIEVVNGLLEVRGEWIKVASINGPLERQVSVGLTTSTGKEVERTDSLTFSASVETGFEFGPAHATVTVGFESS